MVNPKQLSIIIVNYNGGEMLYNCVESIYNNTSGINYEIIVVDNNSTDESCQKLIKQFKYENIKVVYNTQNYGFGKANNIGANHSDGKYLAFLNNDTLLFENSFKSIVDYLEIENNNIAVTCKILNSDKSPQYIGGDFPNPISELLNYGLFQIKYFSIPLINIWKKTWESNDIQKLDWVSGCLMVFKKSEFTELEGFDENIFMYYEDADICKRIYSNSGIVMYLPFTGIVHLKGATINKIHKNDALGISFKSCKYYLKKNYGSSLYSVFISLLFIVTSFNLFILLILTLITLGRINKVSDKYKIMKVILFTIFR